MTHQGREEQVIRRILSVVDKGFSARLLPDHVTLFDLRFVAPSLAAKGLLTELVSTQRGQ